MKGKKKGCAKRKKGRKVVMAKGGYAQYLQSEWWQNLRRRAIEQADGHCAICGSEENLNVHHNTYERLGHERLGDLVVLCQKCHELYHTQSEDKIEELEFPVNLIAEALAGDKLFESGRLKIMKISPEGKLCVNARDSVILHHLIFLKEKYINKINLSLGKQIVVDIIVRGGKVD